MFRILTLSMTLWALASACGPHRDVSSENRPTANRPTSQPERLTSLTSPRGAFSLPLGEDIPVKLSVPDTVGVDSVQFYLGGSYLHTLSAGSGFETGQEIEALIPSSGGMVGKTGLRLRVFFHGGRSENQSAQVTFLANKAPVEYSYSVVKEYPHDIGAFTQGLQYVDGWMYEGTGNYGTSSLRKVRLETGEVIQIRDLDQDLFGEGITVMGDQIFQLTYRAQVGFVYNKHTFEEIRKVYYQNREGWGLTHNGEELIMSDGTHVIYFLDPELFTVNRQLQVYTDKGPADSLNELEYIRGKIWANRYFTDEIVIIDPQTGMVEGRINLKGILKASDRRPTTDVLNGIAWDPEKDRLFVTGKLWPKLFEIRLRELSGG